METVSGVKKLGKPHRVTYYRAQLQSIPVIPQKHEYKCPLCSNYNPKVDTCVAMEIEGLFRIKRLRIVFCLLFSLGEYKEMKKEATIKRKRNHTFIVVGYDEESRLPLLEVRK